MPVSSTHCQIGSVIAVGLIENGPRQVSPCRPTELYNSYFAGYDYPVFPSMKGIVPSLFRDAMYLLALAGDVTVLLKKGQFNIYICILCDCVIKTLNPKLKKQGLCRWPGRCSARLSCHGSLRYPSQRCCLARCLQPSRPSSKAEEQFYTCRKYLLCFCITIIAAFAALHFYLKNAA